MTSCTTDTYHETLECGIELAVRPMPHRHVVSFQIMVLSGYTSEPREKLGLGRLIGETIDKGTQKRSGRELLDAFDAIGARHRVGTGRETTTLGCTVLGEHFERAVELQAEMLTQPTFEEEAFKVNVELARQEISALEDDPQALLDKVMAPRVMGPLLGRHPLGKVETLDRLTRDDLVDQWKREFCGGRMIVAAAGPIEPQRAADILQRNFEGFGRSERAGREPFKAEFEAGTAHLNKKLEQEQILIAYPGAATTDDDQPVQKVMLGVLSGGMSGRLFTEVREKQGLVYWVGAWQETPRGTGMIFLGASTKPERCQKTYETLLHEVDRLAKDIEPDELSRAITGIVAGWETRGESTQAQCGELANDLFHHGHPVPRDEKVRRIEAVSVDDIVLYLANHPRDRLCIHTLGPTPLSTDS